MTAGYESRETEDIESALHGIAQLSVEPVALLQHRDGFVNPAVFDGMHREGAQGNRLDPFVEKWIAVNPGHPDFRI